MKNYDETLVYTESEDGFDLEGIAIRPNATEAAPLSIVWIHGNTGNFYFYPYIVIGRQLAERGYNFFCGNTRGHDVTVSLWNIKENHDAAGGSAWEQLEDSPHDVAAWVNMAAENGQAVVLVGHSQGAAKVAYYQALRQDKRVKAIALASPDLHGHWSDELVAQARQLVAEGKGDELLPPLMNASWYRLSAKNVASRAAVLSKMYDDEAFIRQLQCPILAFFGGAGDVGAQPELDTIRRNAPHSIVTTQLLPNADHVYIGQETAVVDALTNWIKTL